MQKALSVTEITLSIKKNLEIGFALTYVKGEIFNFKAHSSGHYYFSLKDENAQLSAVFFAGKAKECNFKPKDGDKVIVKGGITVFAPRGTYQILVEEMRLDGVGSLLLKLHELKQKLGAEGLFDPAKKKKLPFLPKTIGVITSPTGAVIQDMIHVISRRYPGFHLLVNPVRVQGEGAAEEIERAIDAMNMHRLADVLIVARGGGSLEDLWPFNEERVVRAIGRSAIPVISAVGHETDYTLADFAADVRAPTPSAAAEMVLPEKEKLILALLQKKQLSAQITKRQIDSARQKTKALLGNPYLKTPEKMLSKYMQMLDFAQHRLETSGGQLLEQRRAKLQQAKARLEGRSPSKNLQYAREKLAYFQNNIQRSVCLLREKKRSEFQHVAEKLASINPQTLLAKGYSILFDEKTGSVIFSVRQLNDQPAIVQLSDGKALGQLKHLP